MDAMLAESAERIVRDLGDDSDALWKAFQENGFDKISIPEDIGGFGMALGDGVGLLRIVAHAHADMPLADVLMGGRDDTFGALCRCAQSVGAMEAALELTLGFAAEREQFGRSLDKFPAIQMHLATMAAELAAATAATEAAIETAEAPDIASVAIAKVRTSEAIGSFVASAHQVHGAIGYTDEYRLAAYSRRLWQWREDFGNEHHWAAELGRRFVADASEDFLDKTMGAANG